jgi:hypothetical protein
VAWGWGVGVGGALQPATSTANPSTHASDSNARRLHIRFPFILVAPFAVIEHSLDPSIVVLCLLYENACNVHITSFEILGLCALLGACFASPESALRR